jgi:hypothetical protein
MKSGRMEGAGHATRTKGTRKAYKPIIEKPERTGHLEDIGVNGRILK